MVKIINQLYQAVKACQLQTGKEITIHVTVIDAIIFNQEAELISATHSHKFRNRTLFPLMQIMRKTVEIAKMIYPFRGLLSFPLHLSSELTRNFRTSIRPKVSHTFPLTLRALYGL